MHRCTDRSGATVHDCIALLLLLLLQQVDTYDLLNMHQGTCYSHVPQLELHVGAVQSAAQGAARYHNMIWQADRCAEMHLQG